MNKLSKEILEELYIVKKFSMAKIAEVLKCGETTVHCYMKKYNIPRRNHSETKTKYKQFNKSLLEKLYIKEKMAVKQIANIFGCSRSTILKRLKLFNIPVSKSYSFDKILTKKWLQQKYWTEKLSLPKIAKIAKCDVSTVNKYMKKHKLTKRTISEAQSLTQGKQISQPWLEHKYLKEQLSLYEIAKLVNCSPQTIHKKLKKYNIKTRNQKEANKKGKEHPRWKGGITPLHTRIRKASKYSEWRKEVFKRDKYMCQLCKKRTGKNINAHHIKSFAKLLEVHDIQTFEKALNCVALWNISNGITVCVKHHKKLHGTKDI